MAALLESYAVPRTTSGRVRSLAPRAASVCTALPAGLRTTLPEVSGLRISRRLRTVVSSRSSVIVKESRRRPVVVCEAQETSIEVADVTKETWQSQVIEATSPVLVEFWAPWCGPCRMILPIIGKLSKTYEGRLQCLKLNTDDHPEIASQYGIRSIPTIIIFKNGEKKDAIIGAVPETTLVTCIEKFL